MAAQSSNQTASDHRWEMSAAHWPGRPIYLRTRRSFDHSNQSTFFVGKENKINELSFFLLLLNTKRRFVWERNQFLNNKLKVFYMFGSGKYRIHYVKKKQFGVCLGALASLLL